MSISSKVWVSGIITAVLGVTAAVGVVHAAPPPPKPGPFATLLFSRTEMTAAINCVPNDTSIARLDTTVAPYLASFSMPATGTLSTAKIGDTTENCTHSNGSLMSSWADATMFSNLYGWSFVSHTASYPADITKLSQQQQYNETCGSAAAIDAHGLHGGHGLIAYPGVAGAPLSTQTNFGSKCFAWGRKYNILGTTQMAAATKSPYWQQTASMSGGPCNDPVAACYNIVAAGSHRYTLPSVILSDIAALTPGKWFTLQQFILVTGTSPAGSAIQWDCTSPDVNQHWANDNERYCYGDWQLAVAALAARPDIKVTDPLSVGIAFGRPATYNYTFPVKAAK